MIQQAKFCTRVKFEYFNKEDKRLCVCNSKTTEGICDFFEVIIICENWCSVDNFEKSFMEHM